MPAPVPGAHDDPAVVVSTASRTLAQTAAPPGLGGLGGGRPRCRGRGRSAGGPHFGPPRRRSARARPGNGGRRAPRPAPTRAARPGAGEGTGRPVRPLGLRPRLGRRPDRPVTSYGGATDGRSGCGDGCPLARNPWSTRSWCHLDVEKPCLAGPDGAAPVLAPPHTGRPIMVRPGTAAPGLGAPSTIAPRPGQPPVHVLPEVAAVTAVPQRSGTPAQPSSPPPQCPGQEALEL